MRDPEANPFPMSDEVRHAIWEMLVPRDIDARGGKLYLVGDSGLGIIDIATP